jgi:type IV pilus assembly protein PilE
MKPARGFTLIELMITVAVVAILATIAYPSYLEQVRKSRRAEAKAALLACAQRLERRFSERSTYDATFGSTATDLCSDTSEHGYYGLSLAFDPATPAVYTMTATRSSSGPQASDRCGDFTYTQDGTKNVINGSLTATQCW